MAILFEILAQTTGPTTATTRGDPKPSWLDAIQGPYLLFIACIVIFYVFMIRGKKKQESTRKEMLNQLKRGDRIQTIGGILGTVVEARDDEVLVKVDESSNTKIRFARSAIHRVLEADKEKNPKPAT